MTTPATVDRLATVSLQTLKYLGLDPADVHTRALVASAQRYRLDPLTGEIQLIQTRNGPRVYITRDGLIALAHRSGQLDGIVVDEERRSSRDDGWTCYVSVWRKDAKYPFRYGAQCKDSEPQAKAGNGPEMALARAERRALKRAFAISEVGLDDGPDTDEAYVWEGDADAEPALQGPAHALAVPASATLPPDDPAVAARLVRNEAGEWVNPGTLPPDWPATPAAEPDAGLMAELKYPASRRTEGDLGVPKTPAATKRNQAAAHKAVGALPADAQREFLDRHGIDDYGTVWPAGAVDEALELPL